MMPENNELLEYDGTFDGFLSCVAFVFRQQQRPQQILSSKAIAETLFSGRYIKTDHGLASRIKKRLKQRLTTESWLFIEKGFAAVTENRETFLIVAIEYGLHFGDNLSRHTYRKEIEELAIGIRQLNSEIHHYQGFTRFNEVEGWLIAVIEPKHGVLPFLMPFFCQRFPNERFIICEKKSQMIGSYERGQLIFRDLQNLPEIRLSTAELAIQQQWRTFFQTVTIEERRNPTCQQTHLPKRFWQYLPEMTENG